MNKKRILQRFLSLLLFCCLLLPVVAGASQGSVVCLGADLTLEQREQMLDFLVPNDTAMSIVTVTNQEERALLGAYIPAAQIGTKSISSVSVKLQDAGKGVTVGVHNITWVTPDMYKSALITAGVADAEVTVAAPFAVSGTAALAGIYKAYEKAAGQELSQQAKAVAGEELAITGQLAEFLGTEEATTLVAQVKQEIITRGLDTTEKIRPAVEEAARELNITLTQEQMDLLTQFALKIVQLDLSPEQIIDQASQMLKTFENLQKVAESAQGFLGKVAQGWDKVVSWFKGIFK